MCCVCSLFVDSLTSCPERLVKDWVQAYRCFPSHQRTRCQLSSDSGLWQSVSHSAVSDSFQPHGL